MNVEQDARSKVRSTKLIENSMENTISIMYYILFIYMTRIKKRSVDRYKSGFCLIINSIG